MKLGTMKGDARPLKVVEPVAMRVFYALRQYCELIKIAGSIRRRKKLVGDIEIVCVPVSDTVMQGASLFGEGTPARVRSTQFIEAVRSLGKVVQGQLSDGRYIKIMLPEGIQLDVFITTLEDFGRQLAIRTGPFQYSHKIIAGGWVKKGWVGTEDGLRRKRECEKKSTGWVCTSIYPTYPPPFHTEQDFFNFIGLKWIEPQERLNPKHTY